MKKIALKLNLTKCAPLLYRTNTTRISLSDFSRILAVSLSLSKNHWFDQLPSHQKVRTIALYRYNGASLCQTSIERIQSSAAVETDYFC